MTNGKTIEVADEKTFCVSVFCLTPNLNAGYIKFEVVVPITGYVIYRAQINVPPEPGAVLDYDFTVALLTKKWDIHVHLTRERLPNERTGVYADVTVKECIKKVLMPYFWRYVWECQSPVTTRILVL